MLFVAIGGFLGAICRFSLSQWIGQRIKRRFPWPTFLINSIGSLLLGMFLATAPTTTLYTLIAGGFLGTFTTFSTFSYEAVLLLLERKMKLALVYISMSTCLAIAGVWIGFFIFAH